MKPTLLDPKTEAKLRAAPFTYAEVGATAGAFPSGYTTLSRTRVLRTRDFQAASAAVLAWQAQLGAGVRVAASAPPLAQGSLALLRIGLGPLALSAPCRVVYVIDEERRQGFAYGTLPGHPESGEEAFVLDLADDGKISFTISAFSRSATLLTKLGGPVSKFVQRAMTNRYLRALDTP